MNIVKLSGGLGNQLFQYAFGQALKHNRNTVCYDLNWYTCPSNPPRPYRLDKFNVLVPMSYPITAQQPVIERKRHYDLEFLTLDDKYFAGYWQYLPYYMDILNKLYKEFCVKKEFYTKKFLKHVEWALASRSISIHVRRGDYISKGSKSFPLMPLSYYVNILKQEEGVLFIFSDDLPWCKSIFSVLYPNREIHYVDLEDYLCFELMKYCKVSIMANSTFGYWAAMFNVNTDKKVYCPLHWLGDEHVDEDRYPKDWIRV